MKPAFGDVEILDQRKDEQVLRETEEKVRSAAQGEGIRPLEEEDISFEVKAPSEAVDDMEDLEEYLDRVRGIRSAGIVLYGESKARRQGTEELSEGLDVRVDFPDQRFREAYQALEDDFAVRDVQFYMTGNGDDSVEAFRDAVPVLDVLLGGPESRKGVFLSYRNGGTVEAIWSEDEDMKDVYDSLQGLGLGYHGAVVSGEQDSEWIIAEDPYEDFSDM